MSQVEGTLVLHQLWPLLVLSGIRSAISHNIIPGFASIV